MLPQTLFTEIESRYGVVPEYLWRDAPDYAVFRHAENRKWFAVLMNPPGRKLGLATEDEVAILNVKIRAGENSLLRGMDAVLPADLPALVATLTRHIADLSATQDNLADSLAALPNLTDTVRYGDVRALDPAPLLAVLDTLLARLAAGGVQGCLNIDHDSASALFTPIRQADYQLSLLDNPALNTYWQRFLQNILAATNAHPLLAGNAARLLFDKQHLDADRCAELLAQNLSAANPSERAAYWLEGYLYQSGTVLLLHDPLWRILDDWLRALSAEHFTELLPLLRRTFSSFEPGERRQLGDKAREHAGDTPATIHPVATAAKPEHHAGHGLAALQTVAAWLNLDVGAVSEA